MQRKVPEGAAASKCTRAQELASFFPGEGNLVRSSGECSHQHQVSGPFRRIETLSPDHITVIPVGLTAAGKPDVNDSPGSPQDDPAFSGLRVGDLILRLQRAVIHAAHLTRWSVWSALPSRILAARKSK